MMRKCIVLVAFLFLALSCSGQVKRTARETIEDYLAMDFDGRLYRGGQWNSYSDVFTWLDAPGWDHETIVRRYKIVSFRELKDKAVAKIDYEIIGDCYSGDPVREKPSHQLVTYTLVRTTQRSIVDAANNLQTIRTPERWAVDDPQLEPHRSVAAFCAELRESGGLSNDTEEKLNGFCLKYSPKR